MLQRTLSRSFRTPSALSPIAQPGLCVCRCGTRFEYGGSQRRSVRRAPVVQHNRGPGVRPLTPEESRRRAGQKATEQQRIYDIFNPLHETNPKVPNGDSVISFVEEFANLPEIQRGRTTVDPEVLNRLQRAHGVVGYCFKACKILLTSTSGYKSIGQRLLFSLSRAGDVEATIFVMNQVTLNMRAKPASLKVPEIAYARAHLAKLAATGSDCRAMVLEGKVARLLGNDERAIELWKKATRAMLLIENFMLPEEEQGSGTFQRRDDNHLSSPWIELMEIHYERSRKGKNEMQQCKWAIDVGCQQDDPTSHYAATTYLRRQDADGNHLATSEWLYHLLKAAASGHQKACHDLAVFYAESGWKYIEDEPPDHLKPTPFDSYPSQSPKDTFKELTGRIESREKDVKDNMFHTAVFPYTAEKRYLMALGWLEIPKDAFYAPSFLFHAQMMLQETLWAGANAPQTALDLSPDRYSYASFKDYKEHKPIQKPKQPEPKGPPNPYYNLWEARECLREVFHACRAIEILHEHRASVKRRRLVNRSTSEDSIISEHLFRQFPDYIGKWFRYPDVREMWEYRARSLYEEAREICDKRGWDIYADDGGLLYKATIRRRTDELDRAPPHLQGHRI